MASTTESLEYGYYATMDEVLLLVVDNVEKARYADNEMEMGARLKMASRSMRCALELFRDWSGRTVRNEEPK